MKRANQNKKTTSKGVKLPLIQNNTQKGNIKENKENLSKGKIFSKSPDKKNNVNEVPQMPNITSSNNNPKIKKSFDTTNSSETSNKNRGKSDAKKKKVYNYSKEGIEDEGPRISEEKLSQLKEQRIKRLKQEKKEEEKQLKLYEKLIEEYKNNSKERRTKKKTEDVEENQKIIISSKKAQTILEEGGMLDAYKYVLAQLCKIGLPTGNVFDYASIAVKNYEKKWKEKKSQMMKEKIDKYYEEKQKELESQNLESKKDSRIVNKSLEHREELKFIQSLDKSRSGRNVVPKIINSSPKSDRFTYIDKNYMLNSFKNESKPKIESKETEENSITSNRLKETKEEKNNKNMKKNNSISNQTKPITKSNNNLIRKNTKNKNGK